MRGQLAIEAAIDTDTFRSIFRTAIRRTHEAILAGTGGSAGLDLADSVAVITSTLQLPAMPHQAMSRPVAKAEPLHARAQAALTALESLGINAAQRQQLDDQTTALLASPESPDGVTIESAVLATLHQIVPADRLRAAALVFSAGQPDPSTVVDLGTLSDSAAQTPGWEGCPDIVARI